MSENNNKSPFISKNNKPPIEKETPTLPEGPPAGASEPVGPPPVKPKRKEINFKTFENKLNKKLSDDNKKLSDDNKKKLKDLNDIITEILKQGYNLTLYYKLLNLFISDKLNKQKKKNKQILNMKNKFNNITSNIKEITKEKKKNKLIKKFNNIVKPYSADNKKKLKNNLYNIFELIYKILN